MNARQPLAVSCEMPCSIIAAGSGSSASSTPIRIMPPAMPRMPEMKEVTSEVTAISESGDDTASWRPFCRPAGFSVK